MRRLNARPVVHDSADPSKENTNTMDTTKFRPNNRSTNLFSRNPVNKHTSKSNLVFFASATISLTLFCFFFIGSRNTVEPKFGIVIDGGSTGTRIHVFKYRVSNGAPEFDFGKEGLVSMRVMQGLSLFDNDPEGAGGSLEKLVDFAKERVPMEHRGKTEIRLMATAGLRLVDGQIQERILESCRRVLSLSGFKFRDDWASVISSMVMWVSVITTNFWGSDEGLYAWVVANYALGTLGGDPQQTTGIIELGGSSAQALLTSGLKIAAESFRRGKQLDPCTPKGYIHDMGLEKLSPSMAEQKTYLSDLHPSGNFSECRSALLMMLQKGQEECSYTHCWVGSTFIPRLQGKFLATENFYHTSKFFGLSPTASLSDLAMAGEQFCGEDWSDSKRKYHSLDEEDLLRYCFSSAYIVALLHDSLEISLDDHRIGYANQVGDIPLDWSLGTFILQSTADLDVENSTWISTIVSNDPSTRLVFSIFFIVLIFTAWYVIRWRKPQLKTIYDLEKGKYIVTWVARYS